jgi:transcriptional/translational regulatory protein YebC/TACO1
MRHHFDKYGGNLGTNGCVSFMFERKGQIVIEREGLDEDVVMEDALEAGAADFEADDDVFEITTDPDDLGMVRDALTEKGYTFISADVAEIPSSTVDLTDEEAVEKMTKLLDMLEDNDDVQQVYHNWNMPDEDDED